MQEVIYYSVIVDSTPAVSTIEQLTLLWGASAAWKRSSWHARKYEGWLWTETVLCGRYTFRIKAYSVICDKLRSDLNAMLQTGTLCNNSGQFDFFTNGLTGKTVNYGKVPQNFEMYIRGIWQILATSLSRWNIYSRHMTTLKVQELCTPSRRYCLSHKNDSIRFVSSTA